MNAETVRESNSLFMSSPVIAEHVELLVDLRGQMGYENEN
jgi:hypothetical protein